MNLVIGMNIALVFHFFGSSSRFRMYGDDNFPDYKRELTLYFNGKEVGGLLFNYEVSSSEDKYTPENMKTTVLLCAREFRVMKKSLSQWKPFKALGIELEDLAKTYIKQYRDKNKCLRR